MNEPTHEVHPIISESIWYLQEFKRTLSLHLPEFRFLENYTDEEIVHHIHHPYDLERFTDFKWEIVRLYSTSYKKEVQRLDRQLLSGEPTTRTKGDIEVMNGRLDKVECVFLCVVIGVGSILFDEDTTA